MHIGQLIKQELESQGRSVVWLARQMSCSRSRVYQIFNKPTIDAGILMTISSLLGVDFFKIYSSALKNNKPPKGIH